MTKNEVVDTMKNADLNEEIGQLWLQLLITLPHTSGFLNKVEEI